MLWNYLELKFLIFQLIVLVVFILINKKTIKASKHAGDYCSYEIKDIVLIILYAFAIFNIFKLPLIMNVFFSIDIIATKFKFIYVLLLENGYSLALLISVVIYQTPKRREEILKMCTISKLNMPYIKYATFFLLAIVLLNVSTFILFKYKILNEVYGMFWQTQLLSFPLYIFLWIISLCLLAPFIEEVFFRGILYNTLNQHSGSRLSFITSVLLWVAIHPVKHFIPSIILGIILQIFYKKSKSVLPSFMIHSGVNFFWVIANLTISK